MTGQRVGAVFHVVDSFEHPSLVKWNTSLRLVSNSHFMKLPMLQWFLTQYSQVRDGLECGNWLSFREQPPPVPRTIGVHGAVT